MAIRPITNITYANRNISFSSNNKKKTGDGYNGSQSGPSWYKEIPLGCILLFSPINMPCEVMANTPVQNPNKIELVDQSEKETVAFRNTKISGNQRIKYLGMSIDDDLRTSERIYFKYQKNLPNGGVATLTGKIIAISPETDEKGRYLVAYHPVQNEKVSKDMRLCRIPKHLAEFLCFWGDSPFNNKAMAIVPLDQFDGFFGKNAVKTAKELKDVPVEKASVK